MKYYLVNTTRQCWCKRLHYFSVLLVSIVGVVLIQANALADNIYDVDSSGSEQLSHSNVIIDKYCPRKSPGGWETISYWIYEEGELQSSNDMNRDGTKYRIVKSSIQERKHLIDQWLKNKRVGTIINQNGKEICLTDPKFVLVDPPGKELSIELGGGLVVSGAGGSDQEYFELSNNSNIIRVDFTSVDRILVTPRNLVVTLKDGTIVSGTMKPMKRNLGGTYDAAIQGLRISADQNIRRITIRLKEIKEASFR